MITLPDRTTAPGSEIVRRVARGPIAANAASMSPLLPTLKIWMCSPISRPAASASCACNSARAGFAGLTNIATRVIAGTRSCSSSSRLGNQLAEKEVHSRQVAAGPGEAGDKAELDGSSGRANTIGIVLVAALAAIAGTVPPLATMTATSLRTRSAAMPGRRSSWLSAQRYSMARFAPSGSSTSCSRPARCMGTGSLHTVSLVEARKQHVSTGWLIRASSRPRRAPKAQLKAA
jgi:hypothetical protein